MAYDDPALRAAYIAGVNAALEETLYRLPAPAAQEVEEWLRDLAHWTGGPPPASPQGWD